jgi:hypothetical protein
MLDRYRPPLAATVQEPSKAEAETPKKIRGRPFPTGKSGSTTRLKEPNVSAARAAGGR